MKILDKDVIKSSHFKFACTILFFIYIIISLGFINSVRRSTKEKIIENHQYSLNYFGNEVSNLLNSIESTALHIATIPVVSELCSNSSSANIDNYMSLSHSLNFLSNNKLYESVAFYFQDHDIIFSSTSGLYPLEEYYDKNFLDFVTNTSSNNLWIGNRLVHRKFFIDYPQEIISYIKKIPLYTSDSQDYMCINLHKSHIEQFLLSTKPTLLDNVLITLNQHVIFDHNSVSQQSSIPITYILPNTTLSLTSFVHPKQITYTIWKNLKTWLPIIFLVPFFIILVAYFYSYIILKPLKQLISRFNKNFPQYSFSNTSNSFEQLDTVFTSLLDTNKTITILMDENLPLLQEKVILNTVCQPSNIEDRSSSYKKYNINFCHPYYVAILVYIPEMYSIFNLAIRDEVRLLVMASTQNAFADLGNIYGAHLDNEHIVFILNTSYNYEEGLLSNVLEEKCTSIHNLIQNEISLQLIFSIGLCATDHPNLHKTYLTAKSHLTFASTYDNEYILFVKQNDQKPYIDSTSIKLLTDIIIAKDSSKLEQVVCNLPFFLDKSLLDLSDAKKLFIAILCSTYSKLIFYTIDISPDKLLEGLTLINSSSDTTQYPSILYNSLRCLLSEPILKEDTIDNNYVLSAIEYIHTHYNTDLSIPEIADTIDLNPIYLNRLFKLSTGKTLSEYLNFYRIEISKKLLISTSHKIGEISEMIGYNDVRSYIRFFKKFTNTTPNQYRKDIGNPIE